MSTKYRPRGTEEMTINEKRLQHSRKKLKALLDAISSLEQISVGDPDFNTISAIQTLIQDKAVKTQNEIMAILEEVAE